MSDPDPGQVAADRAVVAWWRRTDRAPDPRSVIAGELLRDRLRRREGFPFALRAAMERVQKARAEALLIQ